MIVLDTSGVDAFVQQARLDMARLDREVSAVFYKWTARIFKDLVTTSPQWSGDLAANWNYSVGSPDFSYTQIPNKTGSEAGIDYVAQNFGVFERGDYRAVSMALERMLAVTQPTWRDTVYFANATPIAPEVEAESIKIRPVNLVEGQVMMIKNTVIKERRRGRL